MAAILGLDFGGTKLAAALIDPVAGTIGASRRCRTPLRGGASASIAAICALAHELCASAEHTPNNVELIGVGVSFGGPVEADGRTVRLSMHVPGWEGLDLASRLEQTFGVPAVVANDGDAAALAEQRFGAGRAVRNLLYLTVSTGIGGGIIIERQLHRGERAWAGEIGHMVLKPDGPACVCGRNGCLEALASGLSIARAARAAIGGLSPAARPSELQQLPPEQIDAQAVARAAAHGDVLARDVWNEAMGWLGIGIASAANLLNPGIVVIGGGVTRAGALLFEPVRTIVAARTLDPELTIVPATLGDDVGVLGAAALMIA